MIFLHYFLYILSNNYRFKGDLWISKNGSRFACEHGKASHSFTVYYSYTGIRTFVPQPLRALLSSVGGTSVMLGLVAMANTVECLYASVKALDCTVGGNPSALKEMEQTGGFQVHKCCDEIPDIFSWPISIVLTSYKVIFGYLLYVDTGNVVSFQVSPIKQSYTSLVFLSGWLTRQSVHVGHHTQPSGIPRPLGRSQHLESHQWRPSEDAFWPFLWPTVSQQVRF